MAIYSQDKSPYMAVYMAICVHISPYMPIDLQHKPAIA